ncbi:MAG: creatininase family protein [Methyloceanibacter sp.]|uniref:creatininase family protein n=1 Tax=Methyloceanibacter sp. TaxID=1965321 RepID=UPI003D6CAD34
MKNNPSENEVARLAWDTVAARLAAGGAAILPIGAGAKEHGLHMPMGADQVIAGYFAHQLAQRIDALIWPTLTYGHYTAFVAYAGSVSLRPATFQAAVTEIADALISFRARRVLILDTGRSTIEPVSAAIAASRRPSSIRHLKVFAGSRYLATVRAIAKQPYGSHADEIETSLMLVIAPELVDMTRAKPSPFSPAGPAPGPLSQDDPSSPNYSPGGSFGDPTLASVEKGRKVLAAILDDLLEAVDTF